MKSSAKAIVVVARDRWRIRRFAAAAPAAV
jgi:hypothetical protein